MDTKEVMDGNNKNNDIIEGNKQNDSLKQNPSSSHADNDCDSRKFDFEAVYIKEEKMDSDEGSTNDGFIDEKVTANKLEEVITGEVEKLEPIEEVYIKQEIDDEGPASKKMKYEDELNIEADKNNESSEDEEEVWAVPGNDALDKQCKKQWVVHRDGYGKNLRKRRTKSSPSVSATKKWQYEKEMKLLLPYLDNRPHVALLNTSIMSRVDNKQKIVNNHATSSRLDSSGQVKKYEKTTDRSISSSKKKSKTAAAVVMKYLLQNKYDKKDEIESLFYSLAQTVRRMDPYHRALAKTKVCSIIGDLELENLAHQARSSSQ